jgi:hypothetical protein
LFHIFRLCKNLSEQIKSSKVEFSFCNTVLFIVQIKRKKFIAIIIKSIERKFFCFQLFFEFFNFLMMAFLNDSFHSSAVLVV